MRVILPFKLVGQKLVKGRDFPKSVADGSKDSIVIKVGGIPDGCIAKGYFKLSWENNSTYDLTFNGDELVVDEYIVTLPTHANNKYIDYKFSFSVAIWEGDVERLTTNPVEIVVEKSNYTDETTNTPDIPESQYDKLAQSVADVVDLANSVNEDVADHGRRIKELKSFDQTLLAKTAPIMATDDYAYAVCDEDGNVVFAITEDGEVDYAGKGSGGGGTGYFNYKQCGLPVLSLKERKAGAHQEMISALKEDYEDKIEEEFDYTAKSPKGVLYPALIPSVGEGECTLKFQGSSSCRNQYPKYNYTFKVKTNTKNADPEKPKFEATNMISTRYGEPVKMGAWGAQKKYCLKANWIDPSNARNVVNARLWGNIVKSRSSSAVVGAADPRLLAAPNCGAINGFPVIIELNGEFRGLYTFNIPKDAWMFNGVNGEGNIKYIVGGESNSKDECGFKAEPKFVDGGSQADRDFEIEYMPESEAEDKEEQDRENAAIENALKTSFKEAVNAVMNANGTGWESAVEPYFDVDSAIDYYIFACCIAGEDNLQKNILYATYGSTADGVPDKWFMSAYDLDTTMGSNPYGTGLYEVNSPNTKSFAKAAERHRLFYLIYTYSKDKLKERYKELRRTILSDENVWYIYNNYVNYIPRAVYNMDAERWADKHDNNNYPMPATTTANVENYMQYYRMHCALLDKEMEE